MHRAFSTSSLRILKAPSNFLFPWQDIFHSCPLIPSLKHVKAVGTGLEQNRLLASYEANASSCGQNSMSTHPIAYSRFNLHDLYVSTRAEHHEGPRTSRCGIRVKGTLPVIETKVRAGNMQCLEVETAFGRIIWWYMQHACINMRCHCCCCW